MTPTDVVYCDLIRRICATGEIVPSRNGDTRRLFTLPSVVFASTPLVTVRKTAWRKAIREMEWFLSGNPTCPEELLDWWAGQLNPRGCYVSGYGEQLRYFRGKYDQIYHLITGLRTHPYSRRHVITTWDPSEMSIITELNDNPDTPTTCHTTIAQFFLTKEHLLSLHSYQRSADMLLGVPHNWIQSWALLLWVAEKVGAVPDKLIWTFGDAHVYQEPSHLDVVNRLIDTDTAYPAEHSPRLNYIGKAGRDFYTSDFEMVGHIPSPIVITRPRIM